MRVVHLLEEMDDDDNDDGTVTDDDEVGSQKVFKRSPDGPKKGVETKTAKNQSVYFSGVFQLFLPWGSVVVEEMASGQDRLTHFWHESHAT